MKLGVPNCNPEIQIVAPVCGSMTTSPAVGSCPSPDSTLAYASCSGTVIDSTHYAYDKAGDDTTQSGIYDNANRQLRFGSDSMTYDLDGNRTRKWNPGNAAVPDVSYGWDALGRLLCAKRCINSSCDSTSYTYGPTGQLARRTLASSVDRYFLWEGDKMLAITNAAAAGLELTDLTDT